MEDTMREYLQFVRLSREDNSKYEVRNYYDSILTHPAIIIHPS